MEYSANKQFIINQYKRIIEEKDDEIERLKAIINYNRKLDEQKILSYNKDEIVFQSLKHFN